MIKAMLLFVDFLLSGCALRDSLGSLCFLYTCKYYVFWIISSEETFQFSNSVHLYSLNQALIITDVQHAY